ncbi:hypothetical protein BGZ57DRAFT_847023 [Hyaloscypha finlandica]|nr:hypothetical protein BGZ57DRAFT_847023 [Hyaloscypha finlandica]
MAEARPRKVEECRRNGARMYEYDYDNSNNTDDASQPSSSYPSSAVVAQQTSVEDLNAHYQGLDLGTGRERGREKVVLPIPRYNHPPPFPIPKSSSSAYDSPAGYYQAPPIASTSPTSLPYSNVPTGQYDSAHRGEYERSQESTSLQGYRPEEFQVTIRKKPFIATISSSNDSFISSETVDYLRLKTDRIKQPWKYRHPGSGKEYDIRESVRINIEPMGGAKLKDVQLYVLSKRCPIKNPVVLGTDILGTAEYAASDVPSSDSGYGTAGSRRPSFNQTAAAYHPATHTADQRSYSSPSPPYHQPIYPQNIPNVPSISYSTSSYSMEEERTSSHGSSQSYYPPHNTSAETIISRDSGFSTFGSGGHLGAVSSSGSGERGMEDNPPGDNDNYTLHSNPYTPASAYTPRPPSSGDEPKNVYSASDDSVYAGYVAR